MILAQQKEIIPDFDKNYFIVKFKNQQNDILNRTNINTLFEGLPVSKIEPLHRKSIHKKGRKSSVLDGIYKVILQKPYRNLLSQIEEINNRPDVIYAEAVFLDRPLQIPNDPLANPNTGSQYYLSLIHAYDAWDISTSNQQVRIAVLDTGIEPDHQDIGSIAINENDPINGVDDDGNGLVDDFMGWDFANSDNDPTSDQSDHGLRVAGISNARVDNAIGIAGIGFDASLVPIKIFTSENGVSSNAYDAIIYAADQGYEILNLSWGSPNSFSQYRQDIINYATIEKGVVIVAAAGNTPANLDFYPASYDNVLSVGATDENDQKADFSTYSRKIDLVAPGTNISSTGTNNSFTQSSGTSLASPQVAAAAALLIGKYPEWTNFQIMEHLRVTTDKIDDVSGNQAYPNMLGSGRLNILKALTSGNSKSVRIKEFSFDNGIGEFAYFGDTLEVILNLQNILSPVENLKLDIIADRDDISIIDPKIFIGNFDSLDLDEVVFRVVLSETIENEEKLTFQISYTGEGYQDLQFIEFETSTDRLDFGISKSFLTTNSRAELGHESNIIADGVGFNWNGLRLLENMGLMIGSSFDTLVDNALTNVESLFRNGDLDSEQNLKLYNHPSADIFASGTLKTIAETTASLIIEHNYYAWEDSDEESNIIVEYRITNTSETDYNSLRVGLLSNWDINAAINNTAVWQQEDSIAIVYDENTSLFSGMAILNQNIPWNYNTLDILQRTISEQTSISKQDKFHQLSQLNTDSLIKTDVIQTLSALATELNSQESIKIAFVITAAENYEDVKKQVLLAKKRYQDILINPRFLNFATTCQGGDVTLNPDGLEDFGFYSDPIALDLISVGKSLDMNNLERDTVVYFRSENENGRKGDTFSYKINVIPTIADFSISPDTLFLGGTNRVYFTNATEFTKNTFWDLGNGLFTESENPSTVYSSEGIYEISLNVESVFGCSDTEVKQLVVVRRNPEPQVLTIDTVCVDQQLKIAASNSDSINVYSDEQLSELIFSGAVFESDQLIEDQKFYVTNVSGLYESNPVSVQAIIDDVIPEIIAIPDTSNLSSSAVILQTNPDQVLTVTDWSIDGVDAGSSETIVYNLDEFSGNNIQVALEAKNKNGCSGTVSKNINIEQSDTPFFSNQLVCKGNSILIEPVNGQYFSFYKDINDAEALGKGRSYLLENINSATTLYIRGIDEFVESNPIEVEILIEEFEVEVNSSVDEVILKDSGLAKEVTFSAEGAIKNFSWFVNDQLVDVSARPKLFFQQEGIYFIKLIAVNNQDCTSEDIFQLNVSRESVITSVDIDPENIIFPNPTSGKLNLPKNLVFINLYTLSGKKVLTRSNTISELDISHLDPGIYLLSCEMNDKSTIISKIILRK